MHSRALAALALILALTVPAAGQNICTQPSCTAEFPAGLQLPEVVPPFAPAPGKELVYGKAGAGVCAKDSGGTERCTGSGGGGGGYTTIQDEGNPLTQQSTVNFIGTPITCVNNAGQSRTDCTVAAGTGTVTNTAGNLTLDQVVVGNGTADAKTRATTGCGGSTTGNCGLLTSAGNLTVSTVTTEDQNTTLPNSLSLFGNGAGVLSATCAGVGQAKRWTLLDTTVQNTDASRIWHVCNAATDTGFAFTNTGFSLGGGITQSSVLGNSGQLIDTTGVSPGHCAQADANGNLADSGAACGGGGAPSFSSITSGTNTSAAMVVGNGASLAASGTGTITATGMSFGGLTNGTTSATSMLVGNSGILATTGSGLIKATSAPWSGITAGTLTTGGTLNVDSGTSFLPTGTGTIRATDVVCDSNPCVNLATEVTGRLPSKNIGDPIHVDAFPGVDCTGASDSTVGFQNLLTAVGGTGSSLWLPSMCKVTLASPGAGNASLTIPSNIVIHCEDPSAGFAVVQQRCVGGTYPGAACTSSATCLGGGTCSFNFGSTLYAPTAGQTYTMMKDPGANANSQDIIIENCTFFTYQADPYQRCAGGANNGDPCRQECSGGSIPGDRCDTSADCTGGGTCLLVADCGTPGGLCTGSPLSASGLGKINPMDFRNTAGVILENVSVDDQLTGDFAVNTGPRAIIQRSNIAREITDCTSPLAFPSGSLCIDATCCYGAHANGASAHPTNNQPGNNVTTGIQVGTDSQIQFTKARGVTTGMLAGDRSRIDESSILPNANTGPGTAGGGFQVGSLSIVAKSYVLFYAGTGILNPPAAITLNGTDSSAIEDRINFVNGVNAGDGIFLNGANNHAIANNIKGVAGANETGIEARGANDEVRGNYVEGTTAGFGIKIALGAFITVAGNQVNSVPVNTLAEGINVGIVAGNFSVVDNMINQPLIGVHIPSGNIGGSITNNISNLSLLTASTSSVHPIHILADGGPSQTRIAGNNFTGGWRGFYCGTVVPALTNTGLIGNRFVSLAGAPQACGGAGIQMMGNYINASGQTLPGLVCDSTCAGGSPVTRGTFCNQDSDCTAGGNTCNASVNACVPEPLAGFLGSPSVAGGAGIGSAHNLYFGNIMFVGATTPVKQCGGTGPTSPGAYCNTGATVCNGTDTCSGGTEPFKTCAGGAGTDHGKFCCTGGGAQTCAVRDNVPMIRVVDPGAAVTESDTVIASNVIFGTPANNVTFFESVSPKAASLGNITLTNVMIGNNNFDAQGGTGNVAIDLPTGAGPAALVTGLGIIANNVRGFPTPASTGILAGFEGPMGTIDLPNGHIAAGTFTHIPAATVAANFGPITGIEDVATVTEADVQETMAGSGTVWKATCNADQIPTGNATRVMTLRRSPAGGGATVSTTMTCQIDSTHQVCTPALGAASAPIAFSAGDMLDWQMASTIGTGTLPGKSVTCAAYVSHDTAM